MSNNACQRGPEIVRCFSVDAIFYMSCNQSLRRDILQDGWCKLCGASYVVQATWCNMGDANNV
eukprot:2425837-Pyramimonas_sp.AAC.1